MLRKLRKKAKFNGDEDFVFANRTGNNPLDSVDIFRRHLHPVSDSLGIPRRSIAKMERACAVLASQAGLTSEQMEIVLRVRKGHRRFPPPTLADVEATRVALARAIQLVLPPELMNPPDPDPTPEDIERARLKADREARLKAFEEERDCSHVAVAKWAKVHISDLYKWRSGEIKESSNKSKRIEALLSRKTRI